MEDEHKKNSKLVYDLHHFSQLESFLDGLKPFETDDRDAESQCLYDSFVVLTVGTQRPYADEDSNWENDTTASWQVYIWNIMSTRFGGHVTVINQVETLGDWGLCFKKTLNEFYGSMQVYITCDAVGWKYANRKLFHAVDMQRLQVAAKFYDLLVLMFDIPQKEPTMAHGDEPVFCPRGKKWRYSAYEDEQLLAEYQKNAEWMALVKNIKTVYVHEEQGRAHSF
jgi:hypothetical protein